MIPYQRLATMIPPDWALANKALQASLEQIKNISTLLSPGLAATVTGIETNNGLNLITSLTEAVPAAVRTVINNTVATGSGPNGTLVFGDVIGTASGYNITTELSNSVALINSMTTTTLQNIYEVMANVANEQYGVYTGPINIPIGEPGYGVYADINLAFANLITLASSNISSLVSTYPTQTAQLNNNFLTISNVVSSQQTAIGGNTASGINANTLQSNLKLIINSFVDSLHTYALDVAPGGANEYLVSVANTSNQTGQAIMGCLREGRNLDLLNNGGVGVDSTIPAT